MRRGDVVTVAVSGDFGKPRPAVVVQSDALAQEAASFIICQMTTDLSDLPHVRITIDPTVENGLRLRSQIMVDRPTTVRTHRIGRKIGTLNAEDIRRLNRALSFAMGLLD
jgi:mRNA interferase MazF